MAELRGQTIVIDATADEAPVHRGVQQMWREQNAAFRQRVLEQLRQARPREEAHPA